MKSIFNYCVIVFASLISIGTVVDAKTWSKLIDESYQWNQRHGKDMKNDYLAISRSKNIFFECNNVLLEFFEGVTNGKDWAIEMVNSWGRFPPSGVLIGTSTDFGSYDQCLSVEPNLVIDRPQYCLLDVRPPLPQPMPLHMNFHHRIDVLPKSLNTNESNIFLKYSEFASYYYWIDIRTGICVPSKCTEQDIGSLVEGFAEEYGLQSIRAKCQTRQDYQQYSFGTIIAIIIFGITLLVTSVATLLERNDVIEDESKTSQFIDTFSIKRNINNLFNERTSTMFSCIHGIRVITILWIILGHTIEWSNYKIFSRSFQSKQIFSGVLGQMIFNGIYSVENFFFIGGMLTSYITLQYTNGKLSRFSAIGYLVSKYVRLTPHVIFYMLGIFLIPLGGWASGPIWKETMDPLLESCSENWWWNLLFLQNFLTRHQICGRHTWFLGVDMQFHWLSTLFIIPILYRSKLGNALTGTSVVAFYVTSIIISFMLDLPPGLINTARDDMTLARISPFVEYFYWMPWSHVTVFLSGLIFGSYVYDKKFKKISKSTRYMVYLMIITGYMTCLMDTYYWNTGRPYNRVVSALIFSTCRLIWSLSTAALIWLCITGNGGLVNDFLSAKVFTPLSRLTYSVYLTHVWVIWVFVGTRRERIDASWTDNLFIFTHNVAISYIIGFLFTVLFEAPVLKIQKRIKNKLFKIDEKQVTKVQRALSQLSTDNNNLVV